MAWTQKWCGQMHRRKVHQGLACSNSALALDVSEKLGLGK